MLILLLATLAAAVIFLWVFVRPLWGKIRLVNGERQKIESELSVTRLMTKAGNIIPIKKRLVKPDEISLAIDEITNTGKQFNINFLSITPREIEETGNAFSRRLPIDVELTAFYSDLGSFFGALDGLKESIVAVREFNIWRDEGILPSVKSELTIDIHLKADDE